MFFPGRPLSAADEGSPEPERFLTATVNPCPVLCASDTGAPRESPTEASIRCDDITGSGAQGRARA
jgi:hypothetical protein